MRAEVKGIKPGPGKAIGNNLTEGPIMKTLLAFAAPIILANLVQQLYSLVDLIVIGHFVGSIGTVGVNTGGEIADLVTPVAMGFSTAGQIYIAQLFGAGKEKRIRETVGTLLTFMLLVSSGLCVMTVVFAGTFLDLLNCPAEAVGQARSYMMITALGMPFIFGYNAVCGVLRGMGESKMPLLFILVAAVVNIVLDILLVMVFHMAAAGTAIATAFSQMASFLAAFLYLWKNRERFDFELRLSYFRIDRQILKVLATLGLPQVARSLMVRSSMIWINSLGNSYGMVVSETNSVGSKLQKFLEVFIQGVDTASAAMIGQNLGAKKPDRARSVTHWTLCATLSCACCISLLCMMKPELLFGIFTRNEEVRKLGAVFLRIMIIHFFSSAVVGAYQAMITGCGFVNMGFVIGLLDGVVCKLGLSFLFVYVLDLGFIGLFWGVSCSRILPAILCAVYFYSGRWRTRKLLTE